MGSRRYSAGRGGVSGPPQGGTDAADRISGLLDQLQISQVELSHVLGVAHSTLSRWLHEGVTPGPSNLRRIRDLERRAEDPTWRPNDAGRPQDAGPLRTVSLPAETTSFLGRAAELAELTALWATGAPWLTVTGPGGVGKTRLANELLRRSGEDLLAVVQLDDLHDPGRVAVRVADELDPEADPGLVGLDRVLRTLAGRSGVVLLDTCERVAAGVAALAPGLLAATPNIRFIATSQRELDFPGEQIYQLPPLDSTIGGAATQFLLARIRERKPFYAADHADHTALAEICERLDGLPMALQLVAPFLARTPPNELLHNWQLIAQPRSPVGASGRHGSIQAAVEWSASLLSPGLRELAAELSTFNGPFLPTDAEALINRPRPSLLSDIITLTSLSWVLDELSDTRHYRMLNGLRSWGREFLTRTDPDLLEHRRRHARFVLALCRDAERRRYDPDSAARLRLLRAELDAALDWSPDHDPALAAALVTSLLGWWRRSSGLSNAARSLERTADVAHLAPLDRARVQSAQALVEMDLGHYGKVEELSAAALTVLTPTADRVWRARALTAASSAAKYRGDPRGARAQLEEARDLLTGGEYEHELAVAYNNLGSLASDEGWLEDAARFYSLSLKIKEQLGDRHSVAVGQANLGDVYSRLRRSSAATRELKRALETATSLDSDYLATFVRINTGEHLLRLKQWHSAREVLRQAQDSAGAHGWRRFEALAARGNSMALAEIGERLEALTQLYLSLGIAEDMNDRILLREVRVAFAAVLGDTEDVRAPFELTDRQREILQLVVDGSHSNQIATELGIAEDTVKRHLSNIYDKLGARNRYDAIAIAVAEGLRSRTVGQT